MIGWISVKKSIIHHVKGSIGKIFIVHYTDTKNIMDENTTIIDLKKNKTTLKQEWNDK